MKKLKWPFPLINGESALFYGDITEPNKDLTLDEMRELYRILAARCIHRESQIKQMNKERADFATALNVFVFNHP